MKKQIVRKLKKTITVLLGAVFISKLFYIPVTYAEGTIDVSIETREININDIPGDRKVSLEVNMNNPIGIDVLVLMLNIDSRLGIDMLDWSNSSYAGPYTECMADPHINLCSYYFNSNRNVSGSIGFLNFTLPENCSPGDFYQISFVDDEISNERICYGSNDTGWHKGMSSFGSLISGGIRIAGDPPVGQPVQNDPPVQNIQQEPAAPAASENVPADSVQSEHETEKTETTKAASETKTEVSSVLTSNTIKKSVTTEEITETEYKEETEKIISEEPEQKEKKNKNLLMYILIIAGAAVIAGAVIIFIKKKKDKL